MPEGNSGDGGQNASTPTDKFEAELRWAWRRIVVLFNSWTTPVTRARVDTFTSDDGVSARAFALLLIVALAFAVRGEASTGAQSTFTGLSAGLAIALSFVLNKASTTLGVSVREQVILSAYASTILVMLVYAIVSTLGSDYNTYVRGTEYTGRTLLPILIAGAIVFLGLVAKSKLWDKTQISPLALRHALILTAGSGLIVWLVARMNSTTWNAVKECLGKANPFSCIWS